MKKVLFLILAIALASIGLASSPTASATTTGTGSLFVPLSKSVRIVDTTTGLGGSATPLGAASSRSYSVAGTSGVPATGVTAVVIDLAATRISSATLSSLRVYASGGVRSDENSIVRVDANHLPNSNTAIVPVGSDGKITVYNVAGAVDFNLDLQGYFSSDSTQGGGYTPVIPKRIVDSVAGVGVPKGLITAPNTYDVQVTGSLVPAGATSIFANVKAFGATANGGIRVAAGGDTSTAPVSVDYQKGTYTDSGMSIKLSSDGKLRLRNLSTGSGVNVIIDVQGYFTGSGSTGTGGSFTALAQQNIYDSATDTTNIGANEERRVQVIGAGGVPDDPSVGSVAMTVSASAWSTNGFVNVYNADTSDSVGPPATSLLSFNSSWDPSAGVITSAIVDLSHDGEVIIQNNSSAPVRVRLSAQGWFSTTHPVPSTQPEGTDPEGTGTTLIDTTPADPSQVNTTVTSSQTVTVPGCTDTTADQCQLKSTTVDEPDVPVSGAAAATAVRAGIRSGALPKSTTISASGAFCVPTGCYGTIYWKKWEQNLWFAMSHAKHYGKFWRTPDGKYVWETASHGGVVGYHSCHVLSTFGFDMHTEDCTAPRYGNTSIHSHYWLRVSTIRFISELFLGSAIHHGNGTTTYRTYSY